MSINQSKKITGKGGKRPGAGRPKGSPNKLNASIKAAIEKAFTEVGGYKYLKQQATDNPVAFMTLLGKVLPTQITGPDDGPVQLQAIEWTIVDPPANRSG